MHQRPHNFRSGIFILGVLASNALVIAGCQQKMADQPSFKPLEPSSFFSDGRSARPVVAGTVARGHLQTDSAFFTGRVEGRQVAAAPTAEAKSGPQPPHPQAAPTSTDIVPPDFRDDAAFVREFPIPVRRPMIEHGYNRYMIYCAVCHDPLGTGHGRIIERGYTPPPSLHVERLRNAPAGRLFAVISEGYGSMPSYASQIPPADRWAIVAYVRALQLGRHFPVERVTTEMRNELLGELSVGRKEDAP